MHFNKGHLDQRFVSAFLIMVSKMILYIATPVEDFNHTNNTNLEKPPLVCAYNLHITMVVSVGKKGVKPRLKLG